MTVTTEPEFYDEAMTGDGEPAMLPLERSPWRTLYEQAVRWIHPAEPVRDLGCGTGRFAEALRRGGHYGGYHGYDFSSSTISEALRYLANRDADAPAGSPAWAAEFTVCDLRVWQPDPVRAGNTIYVCLETLEHLEDDVALIERLPPGHRLIFSVPNFGGEAHLRAFETAGAAWKRYGHLLHFEAWELLGSGPNHIHLYRARRRGDSW